MYKTLSNKDKVSKFDQVRLYLRFWSHLLKKSVMEKWFFCAVSNKNFKQIDAE